MQPIKVLFITNTSVPYGMANSNRLLSLAKGVVSTGNEAQIVIINPTEKNKNTLNKHTTGVIDNISYQYLSNSTIWPNSKVSRIFIYITGLIKLITLLSIINQSIKPKAVIVQNLPNIYIFCISIITKLKKIALIQERNEFPIVQKFKHPIRRLDSFASRFVLKFYDGMILITKELCTYFKTRVNKKCEIQQITMTVDNERFNFTKPKRPIQQKYIAYAGTMEGNKDGLSDLLKAFAIVKDDFPNLILCLIGEISNNTKFRPLKELVHNLKIDQNIVFTGRIDRNQIPAYFLNAELLLLARPNNIQAKGGFPTKLGEYLASGVPVVITNVGEISQYLTDKKNAYIAEPDNPISFASKIKEALQNYNEAKFIGEKGKEVANNVFSYKVQGRYLIEMIRKIAK